MTHHESTPVRRDVVCIGGAMTGTAAAYFLSEHPGFDGTVTVVEPDPTYVNAATTRAQNSIREQFTTPLNIAMSQFGMQFINEFEHRVAVDGHAPAINFVGTGYLFLADDEVAYQRLASEADTQRACGAKVVMLRPDELAEQFPYLDETQVTGARFGSLREGSFDGWALLQGMRQRAIANGVEYVTDRVVDLTVVNGKVAVVHLESGATYAPVWVVNAAGCHAPRVAAMAGVDLPIEPRSRSSFVFDCRTPIDANVPLTITPAGVHFRREQGMYMCGAVPVDDVAVDPTDLDVRHDEFDDLIWPVLAQYVPQFDRVGVVTSWGGQYDYNTLDHNLIVGPAPDVRNLCFANGFSGHGLQHGPAVGRAISELIVDGRYHTLDLSGFGYDRIASNRPLAEGSVI